MLVLLGIFENVVVYTSSISYSILMSCKSMLNLLRGWFFSADLIMGSSKGSSGRFYSVLEEFQLALCIALGERRFPNTPVFWNTFSLHWFLNVKSFVESLSFLGFLLGKLGFSSFFLLITLGPSLLSFFRIGWRSAFRLNGLVFALGTLLSSMVR